MNVGLTVPVLGVEVDNTIFYAALVALLVTGALSIVWKSIGKGALVAILFLAVIIYLAMNR